MRRICRVAQLLSAFALAGAIGAQAPADSIPKKPLAPPPDLRQGFYAGAGVGYGTAWATVDINGPASSSQDNMTFYLAAGFAINRHLRLGAEFDYFRADQMASVMYSASTGRVTVISAAFTVYPSATANLWFKGTVGYAGFAVSDNVFSESEGGIGLGVGIGYDYRVGRTSAVLTPFVNYFDQLTPSKFTPDAYGNDPMGKVSLLQFGIGLGYRH